MRIPRLAIAGLILIASAPCCCRADTAPDPHQQLNEILNDDLYQAWRLRQKDNMSGIGAPPQGLIDWLQRPFIAVKNWIRDFFKSLFRGLGRMIVLPGSSNSSLPGFLQIVGWMVLAIALAFIAILLFRVFGSARHAAALANILSREQIQAALESGDALALKTSQWMEEASRLAAEQDFRMAYRALYLALLSGLHTAGKIEHNPNRTNWIYVQTFRGPGAERDLFGNLTDLFDRVWYGRKPAGAQNLHQLRGDVAALTGSGRGL